VRVFEDVGHLRKTGIVEKANSGAKEIGDSGDETDGLEGMRLRRATAACDCRIGVGADDGDGLDFCGVEREKLWN
jgi:hypothetical protein